MVSWARGVQETCPSPFGATDSPHTVCGCGHYSVRPLANPYIHAQSTSPVPKISRGGWFQGSGYPATATGTAIPFASRIIAVADAYDAMTQDRAYRVRLESSDASPRFSAAAPHNSTPISSPPFWPSSADTRSPIPGRARPTNEHVCRDSDTFCAGVTRYARMSYSLNERWRGVCPYENAIVCSKLSV
jgi:hypothetical protein